MSKFEEPKFDIIKLNSQDTITTSGGGIIDAVVGDVTSGDGSGGNDVDIFE